MVLREIGFPLAPAFVWSPSGEFLALAGSSRLVSYLGSILNVYRDLALISEDTIVQTLLIQDNVIAYFWSPDGSKLAYVTPSPTTGMPRWMVLNIDDGERWPLVDFEPSSDQLTMFQFFDQYAYSHSLWSPDSQSIVFAGRLADGASSVSAGANTSLQRSHIIVVGADPVPTTQTIANGTLGIWSPK
jgi:TolB protein